MSGLGDVGVGSGLIEATVVGAGDTGGGNASGNPGPSALEGVEARVVIDVDKCGSGPMFSVESGAPKKQKTKSGELEQCKRNFKQGNSEMWDRQPMLDAR